MNTKSQLIILFAVLLLLSSFQVEAGPIGYGICQTGCAAVAVACYSAGGFTFGTVTAGVGAPAVVLACNAAFGTCSAKCALVCLLPTP